MKLSDIKGEEALDVLADIIEPAAEIMADKQIANMVRANVPKIKIIKPMIKNHKTQIIEILARIDGKEIDEYKNMMTLTTLPMRLIEFMNDPQMAEVFHSQVQSSQSASSGLVTESTEAIEQ